MEKPKTRSVAIIAFLMVAMLVIPSFPSTFSSGEETGMHGSGTDLDPFLVSSVADLKSIGTGKYTMKSSYRQVKDIVFTEDDALNKTDKITLKFETNLEEERIYVTVLWNDSILELFPKKGDFVGILFNDIDLYLPVDAIDEKIDSVFDFPYENYKPNESNLVVLWGIRFLDGHREKFGVSNVFCELPEYISDNIGGNFSPIGSEDIPFEGKYNGCFFDISGIKVFSASDNSLSGLFGKTIGAKISNIRIVSNPAKVSYFIANTFSADYPVNKTFTATAGSIVGTMSATLIDSCFNEGTVVASNVEMSILNDRLDMFLHEPGSIWVSSAGGLVGDGYGNVENSLNNGNTVSISGKLRWIKILSNNENPSIIISLDSDSQIYNYVGGILGRGDASNNITNSSNKGAVFSITSLISDFYFGTKNDFILDRPDYTEMNNNYSGGIAGYIVSGNLTNSSNCGEIHVQRDLKYNIVINDKTATYLVIPSGSINIGGLVGLVKNDILIKNCLNSGDIILFDYAECDTTTSLGGIVGYFYSSGSCQIDTSCATNEFFHEPLEYSRIGGIIGVAREGVIISESYYMCNNNLDPAGFGTYTKIDHAKIGLDMVEEEYGINWDFDRVWLMGGDFIPNLYPRFFVEFVSDDPALYVIETDLLKTGSDTFLVDNFYSVFHFNTTLASSYSKPKINYDDGESVALIDGNFNAKPLLNNGSPQDRLIKISDLFPNKYLVNLLSGLPSGVTASISNENSGTVSHGDSFDIVFDSQTYDVSKLSLSADNGNFDVVNKGYGIYTVNSITEDIDITASGFTEIDDLIIIVYLLAIACVAVSIGLVYGAIKLIRVNRVTKKENE